MPTLPRQLDLTEHFPSVSEEQWRQIVERDLRGAPFEKKLVTHTYEGIRVQPLFTPPADASHADGHVPPHAGWPPFTRGVDYLGRHRCAWDLRQERAEPMLDQLNAAMLEDLEAGVGSVLLRLDLAGRSGRDPDAPGGGHFVGRDGASLSTLHDLDHAFEGVHLEMIALALEAGAAFLPASALVMALWEHRGVAREGARGAFNADPLAVLARDARLPQSLGGAFDQMADLAAHTRDTYPRATSVRVGSAPYHHAGATAAQDLAFSMATGVEYLRALTERGLSVDDACRQMLFSYAVGSNFFLGASKLRAARRLWHRVATHAGASDASARMRMHVRTSKRVLTTRDAWVNMLRNTACLFAASIAGADVITSAPYEQAIGLPSARGRRIARNTATILAEEAHLLRVGDPAGGSWYIESLTNQLADKAWLIFQAIERQGGMARALTSGWVHEQLREAQALRERNISTRRDALVGVSEFPILDERDVETTQVAHATVAAAARKRLLAHREALDAWEAVRLVPQGATDGGAAKAAMEAVAKGATLGDLAQRVFQGEPATLDMPVTPHPYAEAYERLRDAADEHERRHGLRPRVALVRLGTRAEFNARAGFSTGFFQAGGFEVIPARPADDAREAASHFAETGADIAVLCSTDQRYEQQVSEVAPALHKAGARTVVLAGAPGEHEADYRAAGVELFIFIKCDVVATLTQLLAEEGVLV